MYLNVWNKSKVEYLRYNWQLREISVWTTDRVRKNLILHKNRDSIAIRSKERRWNIFGLFETKVICYLWRNEKKKKRKNIISYRDISGQAWNLVFRMENWTLNFQEIGGNVPRRRLRFEWHWRVSTTIILVPGLNFSERIDVPAKFHSVGGRIIPRRRGRWLDPRFRSSTRDSA